jgi:CAAX protease family protein
VSAAAWASLRPPPARPERPTIDWRRRVAPPPDHPELPEQLAEPQRWPVWYGPVALIGSFVLIALFSLTIAPWALLAGRDLNQVSLQNATFLLVAIVVQDMIWVALAVLFAIFRQRPRRWQFGIRRTRFWPTAGWALLGIVVLSGFEFAYIALVDVNQSNVDELPKDAVVLTQLAVSLAVIVVAPITEEIFFRAFFYRALRTRLPVLLAALIDGIVFGALHYEGYDTLVILPVIAVFGLGQCLVYEKTGSLFAVIAIHAAFNTIASVGPDGVAVPLIVGVTMLVLCVVVPWRLGKSGAPSPLHGARGRRSRAAWALA